MTSEPARLHDLLALSRERGGPAFVDEAGVPVTAAAFDARVAGTADWLSAQGLRAGDCLAVWLDNGLDWPALLFAAARLGLRIAAVNTRYKAFELEHIIARSYASLIVLGAAFIGRAWFTLPFPVLPRRARSRQRCRFGGRVKRKLR